MRELILRKQEQRLAVLRHAYAVTEGQTNAMLPYEEFTRDVEETLKIQPADCEKR
jgi:hypothetical protein